MYGAGNILDTAGEGYTLDTKTFKEVVAAFLDICSKGEDIYLWLGRY